MPPSCLHHLGAPERLIGTNTVDCMQAGAVYSNAAAMLDGLIDRVEEELGEPVTAVATGGLMGYGGALLQAQKFSTTKT